MYPVLLNLYSIEETRNYCRKYQKKQSPLSMVVGQDLRFRRKGIVHKPPYGIGCFLLLPSRFHPQRMRIEIEEEPVSISVP